ncbi:MAG: hypothetical protein HY908_07110 [Myxococcales bacterium]|nr:hypothetical protein [Myxococcales bacterium]
MKLRRLVASSVLGLLWALAPAARAQDPAVDSDELLAGEAAKLWEAAREARAATRFGDCYAKARAAWLLERKVKVAALVGDCAVEIGRHREAAEYLTYYLTNRSPKAGAKVVATAEAQLARATAHVARLRLEVPVEPTDFTLDGAPLDTPTLFLDGKGRKTAPHYDGLALFLEPGTHRFDAQRAGHTAASETRDLAPGTDTALTLALAPIAVPVPVPLPLPDESIGFAPGGAVLGLGVAAVAIGAGLLAAAGGKTADADQAATELRAETGATFPCAGGGGAYAERCAAVLAAREDHDTLLGAGRGLLIGGAVGAAAGVVLLIVGRPAETAATVSVAPMLGPTVQGIHVGGAF